MRDAPYELKAPKQTVSVTVNSDLYAKAKRAGINVSQVAEQAVADAYARRRAELIAAEIREDLSAVDDYSAQHGDFAELARAHYDRDDGAV
jgi:post-segregation antitoxin (ccd killing protein)